MEFTLVTQREWNQHKKYEKYMANARNLRLDSTQPTFHWVVLGFCVWTNANFKIRSGDNANFSVFRYRHVGIPNAKFRVGGLSQRKDPTQMFLRPSGIEAQV